MDVKRYGGTMPGKPTVFVREATGLVKNVSLIDAISMNAAWMGLGANISLVALYTVFFPTMSGVNLVYGSVIGFLLVLPQMYIYTIIHRRMPRTGGDYVWMSRQIGGLFGSALGLTGACLNFIAFVAIITLSAVFSIGSVGLALGNPSYLGLALPGNLSGSDPMSQFVLGSVIFTVLVVINIVSPKYAIKLLTILVVIGVVGIIAAVAVLLGGGRAGVVNYVNSLGIKNLTYDSVASSYTGSSFDLGNTMLLMPFYFNFLFPWFNMSTIAGSELRAKNTLRWSVPISGFSVFIIWTVVFATLYSVAGFPFINAAFGNSTLVYDYGFNFWTLAMGVANNFVLSLALGAVWIIWNIIFLMVTIMAVARYILALSFDRFLPSKFAYVSPRFNSPVVAHLLDLILAVILIGATVFYYGPLSALSTTAIGPMVFFMFVAIASILYGIRTASEKSSVRITLVIAGAISAVVFAFVSYQFVTLPSIYGGNLLSYSFLLGSFVGGLLIYIASKQYLKKQGLDLSLIFKEIPPE
jgi:amino acid transporter